LLVLGHCVLLGPTGSSGADTFLLVTGENLNVQD
jgi:hypothetical protein